MTDGPTVTPPWSVMYVTTDGRRCHIVHSGPAGGTMVPINGDNGTVRVEYMDRGHVDDYGWEDPATLTRDDEDPECE